MRKQFARKEPSKKKWIRASKRCQMKRTLTFTPEVLGRRRTLRA